jgi:chemotaxis protein methyltransferase CheR
MVLLAHPPAPAPRIAHPQGTAPGVQPISDREYARFQRFILERAGITLLDSKRALVAGRLARRLREHRLDRYGDYLDLLLGGSLPGEVQTAVDLLTTNETYFFREPRHFEVLRTAATQARDAGRPLRAWSAACSTGEEAYSMAMVLADVMGEDGDWEVLGSDISSRVLQQARTGHYGLERTQHIPPAYLRRFCLKGIDEQDGTLLIDRQLRERMRFVHLNLNGNLPQLGSFDVVFLRNVMIYFSADTKREVVARVLAPLRAGGLFCIGHSESLNDISRAVEQLAPAVYRKT